MPGILTYIAFISIVAISLRLMARDRSIRITFLVITTLWSILIVLGTELLSLFGAFTFCGLGLFWMIAVVLIGTSPLKFTPMGLFSRLKILRELSLIDRSLIIGIAVIVTTTAMTALIAPPNNWDSMTYHMSRVAHWLQNQSVQFYPTSMPRQLLASPGTEYAIAQLQILSESDRFANLIQWWSMMCSIIGVSLIARALGAGRRGQIISAVLCAAIPVGILQASSTQNDYAAALWCTACVYFGLSWLSHPRHRTALLGGLCLGLAVLTKSTTLLFLPPFLIWMTFTGLRLHSSKFPAAAALLIVVPLLINAPQFLRNYDLSGNIFSLTSESRSVTNATHDPQAVISTALRYLGLNLCTSSEILNQGIASVITKVHAALGWDIMDPSYSMGNGYKIGQDIHEDNSCNTALTIVLLVMTVVFIARAHRKTPAMLKGYLLALAGGFLLFCLLLKWQPWGNRLLLPLYVLSTPFLGTLFDRTYPRAGICVAFTLLLLCVPWLTHNRSRPLIDPKPTIFTKDRNEQYFSNIPGEYFSYKRAAEEIEKSGCRNIALVMSAESWEYPLWPLLGAPQTHGLRMEHVNVSNPSQKYAYPLGEFDPCIAVHDTAQDITRITIKGATFIKTDQWAYLSLFRKDPDGKLSQLVRNSSFAQMVQLTYAGELLLKEAQARGTIEPGMLDQLIDMRRKSVQHAQMLDIDDLNSLYPQLGSAVKDLFIEGNTLFIDGLFAQDQAKVAEGEERLNRWNTFFALHAQNLQKLLQ